jgi:hypothetical protein
MTAQASEYIRCSDKRYAIAAIENEWPFQPQAYGFTPKMMSTACWRGYQCTYCVTDDRLYLDSLRINIGNLAPREWLGVTPTKGKFFRYDGGWEYNGVALPISYSGGVVLGHDFIREFYVHMGFHRPHCYKEVLEIVFRNGCVVERIDHSERMAELRAHLNSSSANLDKPDHGAIKRFVDAAFSLKYEDKWA